jgi:type I protein arginine methyltransferase
MKMMLNNQSALENSVDGKHYLGQFIPLQYHHNMLMDDNRMNGFKSAIDYAVFSGAKVLELGGGTGVLSWLAAVKAEKVWCVEFNPELVSEARRLLSVNPYGERVEVIHADAFDYLPPEPVDIVICEMIHTAMLREKQVEVINSFKKRYLNHFKGHPLPRFIPEAVIMAVQPLQQDYHFKGFYAPIIQFQDPLTIQEGTVELAPPSVYSTLDFSQNTDTLITWEGLFKVEHESVINALRFITKNILAIVMETHATIDWLNHYLVLPVSEPLSVKAGDIIKVSFNYYAGASIQSLQEALNVKVVLQH